MKWILVYLIVSAQGLQTQIIDVHDTLYQCAVTREYMASQMPQYDKMPVNQQAVCIQATMGR